MPRVSAAALVVAGVALGTLTGLAELLFMLVSAIILAAPAARPVVFGQAGSLAAVERRRLARYLGSERDDDYSGPRAWRYLAARCVVGLLGGGVLALIAVGAVAGVIMLAHLVTGQSLGGGGVPPSWTDPVAFVLGGALLVFLTVRGLIGVARLDRALTTRLLSPDGRELLRRRVMQLTTARSDVVEAVDEERRRIERELHNDVQQRLVALGVLLGRARRSADQARVTELLRQAHEESVRTVAELREVPSGIYPIALHEAGLHAALESLAERSVLPMRLRYELPDSLRGPLATVAYFVVSEAVTNAVKHSGADAVDVTVARAGDRVTVCVTDDGCGGADITGTGLSGVRRRVAAVDGTFRVDSPAAGLTSITAELPCA